AVIADFAPNDGAVCALLAATHIEFPSTLRDQLFTLQATGDDELVRSASAANALGDLYAYALRCVCMAAALEPHDVIAAGVHGHTVRHRPAEAWTLQIHKPPRSTLTTQCPRAYTPRRCAIVPPRRGRCRSTIRRVWRSALT